MPQIRSYESQVAPVGPIRQAPNVEANVQTARATQQLGGAAVNLGETIQKYADMENVTELSKEISRVKADFTNKWQEALKTADPNDKEFATRFMNEYRTAVDEVGSQVRGVAGQRFYDQAVGEMDAHFSTTVAATSAELAANRAKLNVDETISNLSASLQNSPSDFSSDLATFNASVDGLYQAGALSNLQADQLRFHGQKKLVEGAVRGWIRVDPVAAHKDLTDGKWDKYVDSDLKKQLIGEAGTEQAARRAEDARLKALEKQEKEAAEQATAKDFLERMTKNPNSVSAMEIVRSNMSEEKTRIYLNLLETSSKNEIKKNPTLFVELLNRIRLPEGAKDKINNDDQLYEYVKPGGIPIEDAEKLISVFNHRKTTAGALERGLEDKFYAMAHKQISDSIVGKSNDPTGEDKYYQFFALSQQTIDQYRKQGKPITNLFDPKHPDYLGNMIPQFKRSPNEQVQDLVKRYGGDARSKVSVPRQRKEKESPDAFLKDIEGK